MGVTTEPPWLNKSVGTVAGNGTTTHVVTFSSFGDDPFTPTNGSLLAVWVFGAVTHSAAGWTEEAQPVNSGELSLFTKTASSDTSITLVHNGSNYPIAVAVIEFPAGSVHLSSTSSSDNNDTFPGLSGLTSAEKVIFGARGRTEASGGGAGASTTWSAPWVEDADLLFNGGGGIDGAYLTLGHQINVTATSITPAATTSYTGTWGTPDRERVSSAFNIASSGSGPTPVSGSLDLRWQVRSSVSGSLDLQWQTKSSVSSSISLPWQVRNAVGSTLDLRWQTRSTASGTLDLRWQVRSIASGSMDLRWQVRSAVTGSLDLRWITRSTVAGTLDLPWVVETAGSSAVSGSLDLRWQVRQTVGGSLDLRWGVLSSVTGSVSFPWAVLAPVSGSLDLRWTQRALVAGTLDLLWATGGSVSGSISLPWLVRNSVSGTLDLRWGVTNQLAGSLALLWISRARANGSLQLLWVVEGSGVPVPTSIRAYLTDRVVVNLDRSSGLVADFRS